jgi:ABC-type multidrug transport system fused ATPase/permease subunit
MSYYQYLVKLVGEKKEWTFGEFEQVSYGDVNWKNVCDYILSHKWTGDQARTFLSVICENVKPDWKDVVVDRWPLDYHSSLNYFNDGDVSYFCIGYKDVIIPINLLPSPIIVEMDIVVRSRVNRIIQVVRSNLMSQLNTMMSSNIKDCETVFSFDEESNVLKIKIYA